MTYVNDCPTIFDRDIPLYWDKFEAMVEGDHNFDTIWFALQGARNVFAISAPIKPMQGAAFLLTASRAFNDMQDALKIQRKDLIEKAKQRCVNSIKSFHELAA